MNPYTNEEVMWQRLKDLQREVENSRLLAGTTVQAAGRLTSWLGRTAWGIAHGMGLAPRWWARPGVRVGDEGAPADTKAA